MGVEEGRGLLMLRARQNGLSLIELLIALAVFGITLAAAAPSYQTWIQNTQIRTAAESIQNGLQLARTEAVRRNTLVRFRLTSTSNESDWLVCVWSGTACTATIQERPAAQGSPNVRLGTSATASGFGTALSAGIAAAGITFNGLGRMVTPGTDVARIDTLNPGLSTANQRRLVIVISPGGAVRMCDPQLATGNPQACS